MGNLPLNPPHHQQLTSPQHPQFTSSQQLSAAGHVPVVPAFTNPLLSQSIPNLYLAQNSAAAYPNPSPAHSPRLSMVYPTIPYGAPVIPTPFLEYQMVKKCEPAHPTSVRSMLVVDDKLWAGCSDGMSNNFLLFLFRLLH